MERLKSALADRYTIEHEIGAGGMATVYVAEDLKVLVNGAGHVPPVEVRIPAINDFLDRTLGRVKTR